MLGHHIHCEERTYLQEKIKPTCRGEDRKQRVTLARARPVTSRASREEGAFTVDFCPCNKAPTKAADEVMP